MGYYEVEDDGYITKDEDLAIEQPHFAPGFQRDDKKYIEGYANGLETAMRFCDNEQDSRAVKAQLAKVAKTLETEADWLTLL